MRKVRIACECLNIPADDLWFEVLLDDNEFISYPKDSDDSFGHGSVNYSGDARRYSFGLYWLDEGVAGTDWQDKNDKACEINILDRRMVIGEPINYTQAGESWIYRITAINSVS